MAIEKYYFSTKYSIIIIIEIYSHFKPNSKFQFLQWRDRFGQYHDLTNLNESSCDLKEPVWLSNVATIEDRNLLPVSAVRYGPHKYDLYKANITIGPLQCQPETEEDRFNANSVELNDLKEQTANEPNLDEILEKLKQLSRIGTLRSCEE